MGYEDTMYVNLPVREEERIVGAVRVAYTVSEVQRKVHSIERTLLLAVVSYGIMIIILTFMLASKIVQPLEALNKAASYLAEGHLEHDIHPSGSIEIHSLGQTLNSMRLRLQQLEFLRRRRISDVSHEIRTPLAAIRAMAETVSLHGENDPTARKRFLARIVEQTDRLAQFVTQLLDLEQIESGRVHFKTTRVKLQTVIKSACNTVESQMLEKGIEFHTGGGTDVAIDGDDQRLCQVFVNLFENAVRYTPRGGIIEVAVRTDALRVHVDVRDTGSGIPSEHLSYIFERFYRVDDDRATRSGGAGLGLCIVKEILHGHGGSITVSSERDTGTTFQIILPKPA